jgi:nucleotide-binding universal stress UspA family protein
MKVECAVCGRRLAAEVAIEAGAGETVRRFCSARCADAGGALDEGVARLPARLLVAVDGSGPSLRAVALAAAMAAANRGVVRLVHAIDFDVLHAVGEAPLGVGPIGVGLRLGEMRQALADDAEAQLAACRKICERAGVPVSSQVEFAPPPEMILQAAKDADLLVMGSRGRGALAGALLGSVSQRVIAGTRTPVLIVH